VRPNFTRFPPPKIFCCKSQKTGRPLSPPPSNHLSPSHTCPSLHQTLPSNETSPTGVRFSCCTSYRTAMQQKIHCDRNPRPIISWPRVMREGSVGDTGTPSTRCDFAMCNKRTGCVTCAWKMREERWGLVDGAEGSVLLHVAICMIMAAHKFWQCLLSVH
jgi:hypothetical protein